MSLGDRGWFQQIDARTRPAVRIERDWWPPWKGPGYDSSAGAPPGGSVSLLGQRRLGPFDVATLDATDAGALSGWLTTNGYHMSEDLARVLDVYVKLRWKYVAVKLAPRPDTATQAILSGELDPLHLTFDSDHVVYPM